VFGWFVAAAFAIDCPEGQTALDDRCITLAGETIAAVPPEVLKAVWSQVTTSDDVKRCLLPLVGQRGARVDVSAAVADGHTVGVVVSSAAPSPGEVEWCVAQEVARLTFPADPPTFRVAIPLVLDDPQEPAPAGR
jgi:hypothetical protein